MKMTMPLMLIALTLLTTGCAESVVLAGNGVSMVVTCVLLWSTVSINRHQNDKE